ncbi:MAG: DUF1801 domain-containing protein [Oscillospiraceae bacterium]|jgi:uncharacterized protein YdhG (YjbR/CyaY superfamily)|nr:DUF1801 domain-containing protein [Oscillospiraceae bacterium]
MASTKVVDNASAEWYNGGKIVLCTFESEAIMNTEFLHYIEQQPEQVRPTLHTVWRALKDALPTATEKISWQMPTFWSGANLVHFAAHKNHVGLYPGAAAMEHFSSRLTQYKTSKGAVQFPYKSLGDEQLALISEIAEWCGKHNAK